MAIISPDERTYCLNVGDTIAISLVFSHPQPNKVWCQVVDGSHCDPAFCQNPFQAGAPELSDDGTGNYDGGVYTVTDNDHHDAHVRFWWIFPNECDICFDKRDFSIAAPDSDSCGGLSFRRQAAAKKATAKAAAKKAKMKRR